MYLPLLILYFYCLSKDYMKDMILRPIGGLWRYFYDWVSAFAGMSEEVRE